MIDDARRRTLLALGLALALPSAARAASPPPEGPAVRFLGPLEGADVIAGDGDAAYFERMNLREIRARMQTPLEGMNTAEARSALRRFYAGQVQAFDEEEQLALRALLERLQPRLAARAPLYARTPWSFVKLGDAAEGGMPHTRGANVVLPASAVARIVKRTREAHAAGTLAHERFAQGLFVHEQTHVLQRSDPARFEPLFTDIFGFVHASEPPMTPWLAQHLVQNPDAPDIGWIFPLEHVGGRGWILPVTVLPDAPMPRMPDDFRSEGIFVERDAEDGGWNVIVRGDEPRRKPLSQIPGYDGYFPYADEDIHPNEIAAVALSHWVLQDDPKLAERPRIGLLEAWARSALA